MQAEFLLTDVNRDFISTCLVELGLREPKEGSADAQKMRNHLEQMFLEKKDAITGTNYAAAILRGPSTALTAFCQDKLAQLITDATKTFHEYRMRRAQLNADTANARYAGEIAMASTRDRQLFIDSINLCKAEFKDDAERKKACLDQVIPIKTASPAPAGGFPR